MDYVNGGLDYWTGQNEFEHSLLEQPPLDVVSLKTAYSDDSGRSMAIRLIF